MESININNLRSYVRAIKEPEFESIGKGKKFYTYISKSGFRYTLGYPLEFDYTSRWQNEKVIKQLLDRFNKIHSFRISDYKDISKDSTYLLAVIRAYLGESWRDKESEKREISSFYIGNFKAIADLQKIPIKPLTLIYGGNSSGKSSIIHSLLALNHIFETGEYDVHLPRLGDGSVDLGGQDTYLHREKDFVVAHPELFSKPDNAKVGGKKIGNNIQKNSIPTEYFPKSVYPGVSDFHFSLHYRYKQRLPFKWGAEIKTKYLSNDMRELLKPAEQILIKATKDTYVIEINSQILLSMNRTYGERKYKMEEINFNNSFISEVVNSTINKLKVGEIKEILIKKMVVDNLMHKGRARGDSVIPEGIHLTQVHDTPGKSINKSSRGKISQKEAKIVNRLVINIIQQLNILQNEITMIIKDKIESFEYLGPVRSLYDEKSKYQQFYIIPYNVSGGLDVNEILLNNQEVRDNVNKWLISEDRLQTSYMFVVRGYMPCDNDILNEISNIHWEEIRIGLHEYFRSKLEKGELEAEIVKLNNAIRKSESIGFFGELGLDYAGHFDEAIGEAINDEELIRKDLILIDRRTQIPVSSKNIGMGINQILPILISAYGLNNRVIMIEQPELHLHPAMQAELADVFIKSALGTRQNTFLLESHSEHLLLRIMRRMRETFEGKLPEGIPPITPEDVAVLFVEPDGPRSIVQEMPLNKHGELIKPWPGGFFEEGLREVFSDVVE